MSKIDFEQKYYLSTDGYYFKYRPDNNDPQIIRATLYNTKDERVDDVRKTEGYGRSEMNHFNIINYFEARPSMGAIK